jgi:nitrogen regulatory protein P-II 1
MYRIPAALSTIQQTNLQQNISSKGYVLHFVVDAAIFCKASPPCHPPFPPEKDLARDLLNTRRHFVTTKETTDMKLIIAYIQPDRLNPVKQALYARNIFKISVTNALGCGQQRGYVHMWRGALQEVNLLKKVRLAIAVNDDFIEPTIEGICEGARTGHIGDGKIFVLPIEECVRIRTGERGNEAIG